MLFGINNRASRWAGCIKPLLVVTNVNIAYLCWCPVCPRRLGRGQPCGAEQSAHAAVFD